MGESSVAATPDELWARSYQQDLQVAICHCSSGGGRRCGEEWAAFKKAEAQDVVSPVPEQIAHTEKFVERVKQRVLHAEECVQWAQEWQVVWEKELKEAEECRKARATRIRSSSGCPTSRQLAQLQAQIQQRSSSSVESDPVAKRPWRREEFRCSNAEEVMEWMHDRQMDIQEELFRGNASEVARLSSLVVQAATSLQPVECIDAQAGSNAGSRKPERGSSFHLPNVAPTGRFGRSGPKKAIGGAVPKF